MFIPFEQISLDARVWVYTSEQAFSDELSVALSNRLTSFLGTWQAHRQDLKASFTILYQHFIVVAVDEAEVSVSGCSIDTLQHFMQSLPVDFTEASTLAITKERNTPPSKFLHFQSITTALQKGEVSPDDYMFYTLVNTKKDIEQSWFRCLGEQSRPRLLNLLKKLLSIFAFLKN